MLIFLTENRVQGRSQGGDLIPKKERRRMAINTAALHSQVFSPTHNTLPHLYWQDMVQTFLARRGSDVVFLKKYMLVRESCSRLWSKSGDGWPSTPPSSTRGLP